MKFAIFGLSMMVFGCVSEAHKKHTLEFAKGFCACHRGVYYINYNNMTDSIRCSDGALFLGNTTDSEAFPACAEE